MLEGPPGYPTGLPLGGATSNLPGMAGGKVVTSLAGRLLGTGKGLQAVGMGSTSLIAAGQSGGGTYSDAYAAHLQRGLPEAEARGQALKPALVSALITGVLTRAGGARGVESVFRSDAGRALVKKTLWERAKAVGLDIGEESLEEGTDTLLQGINARLTYDPDKPLEEILGEAFEAAWIGGVLGGSVSGVRQGAEVREQAQQAESPSQPATIPSSSAEPKQATSPFRNAEGKISVPKWDSMRDLPEDLHAFDREIKAIVDNQEEADRRYNALPDSKGGKVINTDIARGLLPAYAESREGRIKYTPATATAAKVYAADRIHREIENRGNRKKLMFTAGGVAAGKSTVADDALVNEYDLVFDGTMRDTPQAIKTIQQALDKGWEIQIHYIQRPIELVVQGAINRANEHGRWGTIAELPLIHADAQRSIVEIAKHFAENPHVKIDFWLNDGKSHADKPKLVSINDLSKGGKYSMVAPEEQNSNERSFQARGREAVIQRFKEAAVSGRVDPALLKRLAGNDPELNEILKSKPDK